MKTPFAASMVVASLLAVLLACQGGRGDGRGGDGGGGPTGTARITGTVSGTTIVAYDSQGNRVAEASPTGTPPNRVFSIALPVGRTYVLFLVENEGTASQRVFPLYTDVTLTTNLLAIAEPGTIDLGFVDTTSGNAIPSSNPLFANGVSAAGQSTSIPAALTSSGVTFSQADLVGSWALHSIAVTPTTTGWMRARFIVAANGLAEWNQLAASVPTGAIPPVYLKAAPGGVVTMAGSDFRGVMSGSKDLVTWIMSSPNGTDPSHPIKSLGFLQKLGTGADASRLAGTYRFHQMKGMGATDLVPGRGSWARGDLVVTPGLAASAPEAAFQTSDPVHNSTASYTGQLAIAADGTVTSPDNATFHGTLSLDGNTLVATATEGGEQLLLVLQRAASGCTAADLVGTWTYRQLEYWPQTLAQWAHGKASIDASLNAMLVEASQPGIPEGPIPVAISGSGLITLTGDPGFRGAISIDKGLLVGVTSLDEGKTVQMMVLQK